MNGFQKVIKIMAICLAIFIIVNIFLLIFSGLSFISYISNENKNEITNEFIETYKDIKNIDINIAFSNIEIKQGNEFKLESTNNEYFTAKQINGCLKVEEKKQWFFNRNNNTRITIYVPENVILDEIDLDAGAGEIKISNISANKFDLNQGAGVVLIQNCIFDKTDIDGGAGMIEVISSNLNNLILDCGAGKVVLEAKVEGDSKISAGIGEINVTLLGEKDDYQIKAEKGIGKMKIDNTECNSNTIYGIGNNIITVEGGIGAIYITFKQIL